MIKLSPASPAATEAQPFSPTVPEAIPQTSAPEVTTAPRERTKRATASLYDKLGTSAAYSGVIAIGGLLWYVGAFYTLAALRSFGLQTNGLLWWCVPVIITTIELALMQQKSKHQLLIGVFALVLIIDVGTSWQGLTSFAGKTLPLFGGIQLPASGAALHITAAIIALVLAIAPEKIARAGINELKKVW